jgi:hypothetical protein
MALNTTQQVAALGGADPHQTETPEEKAARTGVAAPTTTPAPAPAAPTPTAAPGSTTASSTGTTGPTGNVTAKNFGLDTSGGSTVDHVGKAATAILDPGGFFQGPSTADLTPVHNAQNADYGVAGGLANERANFQQTRPPRSLAPTSTPPTPTRRATLSNRPSRPSQLRPMVRSQARPNFKASAPLGPLARQPLGRLGPSVAVLLVARPTLAPSARPTSWPSPTPTRCNPAQPSKPTPETP